ncbi:MAG TPA: hypothetical protein VIV60_01670 [Polyangiaceae bacterium]
MATSAPARDVGTIDKILAIQLLVAWAGEGRSEPKRLGWWDTDLVDEAGEPLNPKSGILPSTTDTLTPNLELRP